MRYRISFIKSEVRPQFFTNDVYVIDLCSFSWPYNLVSVLSCAEFFFLYNFPFVLVITDAFITQQQGRDHV